MRLPNMQAALKYKMKYGNHPLFDKDTPPINVEKHMLKSEPQPDLFKPALSNSIDALYDKKTQLKIGSQAHKCYCAILEGAESQREISDASGVERYLVPDRLQRLLKSGHIVLNGSKVDELSKLEVLKYKVV